MKVKVIWEFEFDDTGFDPKFVDIPGLAKDSAKRDIQGLIDRGMLCAEDFEYITED